MEVRIQAAVRSDRGRVRQNNEDNFFFAGETMALAKMDAGSHQAMESGALPLLFAVSDGMGGEEAGEEASTLTVELLSTLEGASPYSNDDLQDFIAEANQRVLALRAKKGGRRVGCTIVLAIVEQTGIRFAHVGDSRAYRVSGGEITQWTRDHTEAEQLRDLGLLDTAQDAHGQRRNALTQHIGVTSDEVLVMADISKPVPLTDQDVWILCSDGVSDMLSSKTILQAVRVGADAKTICDRLVDAALEAGGRDNATALVLRVLGGNPAAAADDQPSRDAHRHVAVQAKAKKLVTTAVGILLVCVSLLMGIFVGHSMRTGEVQSLKDDARKASTEINMLQEEVSRMQDEINMLQKEVLRTKNTHNRLPSVLRE